MEALLTEPSSPRGSVCGPATDRGANSQRSTGDKDQELESLRKEVLTANHVLLLLLLFLPRWYLTARFDPPQIAVLRGESAVAKTLQAAVEALEGDKARLRSRVHGLEQRLMGTRASEGGDREAPPSGEEARIDLFLSDASAGDAAMEQLREEKEFAEGQVRIPPLPPPPPPGMSDG